MSARISIGAGIVMALAVAAPAWAQNADATPTYGDVELSSGFDPDPYETRIQAGGPLDGSESFGKSCPGYIAAAPDINFDFAASDRPLYIYIDADADTTLIIIGPDGEPYCDDDSGKGLNAAVIFLTPQSGLYHIWVGTYRSGAVHPASIMFSEIGVD